jgi:hypothetical protein
VATTIPVPIEFSLPEGWRSVPPDEVGTPEAAFVALFPAEAGNGFTPNITLSGEVYPEDVALTDVADEALERLRAGGAEVKLGRRNEVGSVENPGLTQAVQLSVQLNGKPEKLVQFQVFLGMQDQKDPNRRAVLHVVLTSLLEGQFEKVIGDFQEFLATIKPEGSK